MAPDRADRAALAEHEDIDRRAGLAPELRVLAEAYPREVWPAHANLGMTARFWLDRHDMFRALGERLVAEGANLRGVSASSGEVHGTFVRLLGFFLNQLNEHHLVEDHHYFPLFRTADPRLARGFELLDRDHETIHADLYATAEAANALLHRLASDAEAAREIDAYAAASERLVRRTLRHLEDEEDLVIPLILDQGERVLGIG